jgi:hypothetical protein
MSSIFGEFCFFPHLSCHMGEAILNIEFFYLTVPDRFTKRDEYTPRRVDTCDPVTLRLRFNSSDLFSHFWNTVFFLSILVYARAMSEVAEKKALEGK